jgi:hypothetical protein
LQNASVSLNCASKSVETHDAVEIARALTVGVEQSFPAPVTIAAIVVLIDAQRERLAVLGQRENERVAADKRRHVSGVPVTVGSDVEILSRGHAEQNGRYDLLLAAGEHDRILRRSGAELGGNQGYGINFRREIEIRAGFDAQVAVVFRAYRHDRFVLQDLGAHREISLVFTLSVPACRPIGFSFAQGQCIATRCRAFIARMQHAAWVSPFWHV